MSDPILWIGVALLAGALGSLAARRAMVPAAAGALLAGLGFAWIVPLAGGPEAAPPVAEWLLTFLAAMLGLALGAEIDLARAIRSRRALLTLGVLQAAAVCGLVCLTGRGVLDLTWGSALLLGAAAAGPSPAAAIAVVSEARARGDLGQGMLALAAFGLALACAAGGLATSPARAVAGAAVHLVAGAVCGGVLLVPLSRMTARGAILGCLAAGALLATSVASLLGPSSGNAVLVAIPAGLAATALIPNRSAVREALRDVTLPCAIAYFALGGAAWPSPGPAAGPAAALLVLAARGAGLAAAALIAGAVLRRAEWRRRDALLLGLGLVPIAEGGLSLPSIVSAARSEAAAFSDPIDLLRAAGIASMLAGLAAAGWAVRRSGEGAGDVDDPAAWRARTR